jgi:hypothetical protein
MTTMPSTVPKASPEALLLLILVIIPVSTMAMSHSTAVTAVSAVGVDLDRVGDLDFDEVGGKGGGHEGGGNERVLHDCVGCWLSEFLDSGPEDLLGERRRVGGDFGVYVDGARVHGCRGPEGEMDAIR